MKLLILLAFFSSAWGQGGLPKPSSVLVGILRQEKKCLVHEFLFRFEQGKWSGARVSETAPGMAAEAMPFAARMSIYQRGKDLGAIELAEGSSEVGKLSKKLLRKIGGSSFHSTSTLAKPRDPEHWRQAGLKGVEESDLLKIAESSNISCFLQSQPVDAPKFHAEGSWAPADGGSRRLVVAKKGKICQASEEKIFFFRNEKGEWSLREAAGFIDIADYNNDGKVETLLERKSPESHRQYDLVSLENFELLASVPTNGASEGCGARGIPQ